MNVTIDTSDVAKAIKELESGLSAKAVKSAVVRGLNRAGVNVRTRLARDIRARLNVNAADLKTRMVIRKANGSQPEPSVEIDVSGKPFTMMRFVTPASLKNHKAQQKVGRDSKGRFVAHAKPKPLKAKILKSKGPQTLSRAFYVEGKAQLFERVGKASLPIKIVRAPSIAPQANAVIDSLDGFIAEAIEKNIASQLDFAISKAMK